MNRVVVIIQGGVADYVADDGVEVLFIDTDNLDDGDELTSDDIKGFEDIVPKWIKDEYMKVSAKDITDRLRDIAFERSKEFNNGELDYAYAFGYMSGLVNSLLTDNLTDEQIEGLMNRLKA